MIAIAKMIGDAMVDVIMFVIHVIMIILNVFYNVIKGIDYLQGCRKRNQYKKKKKMIKIVIVKSKITVLTVKIMIFSIMINF